MHLLCLSKKTLSHVQFKIVVLVAVVAVVASVTYYLTVSAPAQSLTPTYPDSEWRLSVDGLVQRSLNLSLGELMTLPRSTVSSELYCLPSPGASGVLVDSGNWTGVRLGLVLEMAGVFSGAVKVAFYAEDGFTTDLTFTAAMREDIIVAYEKNGKPLPETLRLATPGMYGYKWIKWLTHIEVVDYDFKGTYESRGFPDTAEIPQGN